MSTARETGITDAMPSPDAPLQGVPPPQDTQPLQDALQHALAWLDRHGDDPLPWTRFTGEPAREHGRGVQAILQAQGADLVTRLVGVLACSGQPPDEAPGGLDPGLAETVAGLLDSSSRLLALSLGPADDSLQAGRHQAETLRRMTLAMARDVRVVMVRLASGLQSLRRAVADGLSGQPASFPVANEALMVLAPLANRLGLFRLKWEMEDLAFRCTQPEVYRELARRVESKRAERERFVSRAAAELAALLKVRGIEARVSGRPKHLYSIHDKLQRKQLDIEQLHDLRALRVLVKTVADCYAALDVVHERWEAVPGEFDDYIARPKSNGYRSLHEVVTADDGRTLEVQIRTRAMHEEAEYGVAAHWRYKERASAGAAGGAGGDDQAARLSWLRQLLSWQQEVGSRLGAEEARTTDDSRIFAMTPQGRVIELPAGATPVDFAYHLHSTLGHRCRGAKVDGRIVPLNTPLANGQVVEITAARGAGAGAAEPGPSRDWLNPALGYLRSQRARGKVRQWFNAQTRDAELAAGRERVEKTLAREGRTSLSLDELAQRLGEPSAAALFTAVARDAIGVRALEEAIRSLGGAAVAAAAKAPDPGPAVSGENRTMARSGGATRPGGNAVLVVGVDFLLTQLARCCHPVPPDLIVGFVTRGKGVTVHRERCLSFRQLEQRSPERVLPASWGEWDRPARGRHGEPVARRYPVGLQIVASDRPNLLRDLTETFARERVNVLSVRSNTRGDLARFNFIVEVPSATRLAQVAAQLRLVPGVADCGRY
jgi:GTP pyrophosphokinase